MQKINLIRLRTVLDNREEEIIKDNNIFIDDINNYLVEDDLILKENVKDSFLNVFFVETGGSETKFLKYFDQLNDVVILISNGKNNSLPAAMEIKTYCAEHDKFAVVLTGSEQTIASALKQFGAASLALYNMNNTNLGVIGQPSDWLIASKVNYETVKKLTGINLIDISTDELKAEIEKHDMGNVPHFDTLKNKFKNEEVFLLACDIYGALKRLVDKYQLKGLTIRCFDLLGIYKNTACLALALLNEEGITATCEGDVPSMLTMHFINNLTGKSSFQANPSFVNEENHTILFAHCTVPLNMTTKYELTTHFESGLGIGIKGNLVEEEVTLCKFFIDKDGKIDNSLVMNGTIKENLSLKGYCRTQINVELKEYDLVNLLNGTCGNHIVIAYGDISNSIYTLLMIIDKRREDKE